MNWVIALSILSVGVSAANFGAAVKHRSAPKSFYFLFLSLGILVYSLGYLFELTSKNVGAAYQACVLEYLASPYNAPLALLFFRDYYDMKIRRWKAALLFLPPAVVTLLVASWPWNGIYYSDISYSPGPPVAYLSVTPSIWYFLYSIYAFSVMLYTAYIILRHVINSSPAFRRKSLANLAAISLPIASNALYVMGLTPYGIDITPFVFSITSSILAYSVSKMNLLQPLPIAKDQLVDNMNDAFIVIDNVDRYLYSNRSAQKLFPDLTQTAAGIPVDKIHSLSEHVLSESGINRQLRLDNGGVQRHYRVSETIVCQKQKKLCKCVTLYDITDSIAAMRKLQRMADYDGLTQVYNRATFMRLANAELATAAARGYPVALYIFDLDHFKKINDTYGHQCGDMVLARIAGGISKRVRKTDIFARYGGEEFCAFLSDIPAERAVSFADNLLGIVRGEKFECNGNTFGVTISIGVCVAEPGNPVTLDQMISQADAALYRAKSSGRDRCVLFDEGMDMKGNPA